MIKTQRAMADVFLTALNALPKAERDAVVVRIARDKALARDILDLTLIADRRGERSKLFREYLSERPGGPPRFEVGGDSSPSAGCRGNQSPTLREGGAPATISGL